ncbi:hypothetical protein R6Q57_020349 [Mikania cordata]
MDKICMEEHQGPSRRHSSTERMVAISLGLICVISPLFIDKKTYTIEELELEEQPFLSISTYLVLVLLVLIIVAVFSCYLDHSLTRFDPYWIYRVGGSSGGIIALLNDSTSSARCDFIKLSQAQVIHVCDLPD